MFILFSFWNVAFLVNQNLGVRAGVVGGVPGFPYFFRQILSDMETIFQWHKFKFQNRREMMLPSGGPNLRDLGPGQHRNIATVASLLRQCPI